MNSEATTKEEFDQTKNEFNHKTVIHFPNYKIERKVLLQEALIKKTGYESRDKSLLYGIKENWSQISFRKIIKGLIPVLSWLPTYPVRKYFAGDLIAGITVAVMHIPQGMAYGILAGVAPSVGLYMAFFPTLAYFILGTSRHISMGTFAVISMMTLKCVQTYSNSEQLLTGVNGTLVNSTEPIYTPINVVTATAMMTGILHILMGLLRLGSLASLLSEPLVNGFTTAAAVHVIVSQFKDVFGVKVPKYQGPLKIVYTIISYINALSNTNITALIFSIGIVVFMILMNEFIKPWLSKKCRFPLPAELIAVVGGTLISKYMNLGPEKNLPLVGNIPVGLPYPEFPPLSLLSIVAVDSIAIAIVSYSVVMSMSLTFAKKHKYEISANQELFALGISNIVGGCFSCIPMACSLSRSLIQEQTGGMTQIASVISALLILIVLLWIGPFFETLPRCVLAGVIIVALKGMFTQARALKKFAKQGKLEFLTWIVTFFGVVIIDIDYGLLLGILVSFLALYIKGWKPHSTLLGTVPDTEIYVDVNHRNVSEVPDMKIYRYTGSINFATAADYKKELYALIEVDYRKIRRASIISNIKGETKALSHFKVLILDLTSVGHIDVAGCKTLSEIVQEMHILDVKMILASPQDRTFDTLIHSIALGEGPFLIFPTIHDAVLFAKANENV